MQLRLLSVVFALLATIALDRLWLKHAPPRVRAVVSGAVDLFGVPAAVLPHGPILQLAGFGIRGGLLGGVALEPGVRVVETAADLGRIARGAALHALCAGDRGLGRREPPAAAASARERPGRLLAGNAIVLAAYLPWLLTLASVLAAWRAKPGLLLLTGNSLLESGVKLAYWVFSFFYGEAIPVWMLPVTALLAIPVAWLLWTGARSARTWLLPAAVTALIGFAGVAGWVSYAFGPARLLFLLPLALLAIAAGAYRSAARREA